MLALYRAGRQADALRAYQRARRVLGDELGIEPGEALRDREQAILMQSPELDWIAEPRATRPEAVGVPVYLDSFVGREHELSALTDLLSTARLVTLTGSGGVGKTRLATRLTSRIDGCPKNS
jgi:hypothetical protein